METTGIRTNLEIAIGPFTASSLASREQDTFRLDLHITICKKMGQNIALWLILLLENKTIGNYRVITHICIRELI